MNWVNSQNVVFLAFLAGLIPWGGTILGAATVFFFKNISRKLLDIMMGFAAGIMIAASFWSLLGPALEHAEADYGTWAWFPVAIGFLAGGFSLRIMDAIIPHLHLGETEPEGMNSEGLSRSTLMFLAMTLHNFPEGLAVGVTYGALASAGQIDQSSLWSAIGLSLGIILHNIPEGAAISIPIRAEGKSRREAFFWGSMSAIVEPIGAILGASLVIWMMTVIPYALAFAAGAMIFVVVEELIPESQTNGNTDVATLGLMVGFVIMMIMDVALG